MSLKNLSLVFILQIALRLTLLSQGMSFGGVQKIRYSTLKFQGRKSTQGKVPFIDVHGHQYSNANPDLSLLIANMDMPQLESWSI